MPRNRELPSLKWQLTGNITISFIACFAMIFFGEYDLAKIFTRMGVILCFLATIFAAYRLIFKNTLKEKESELFHLDELATISREAASHNSYTEETYSKIQAEYDRDQNAIYNELSNVINIGEREKAHLKLSIVLLAIGTVFQIVGAT